MKQGTILQAREAFSMKAPGTRGRPVSVKAGDEFWVTTATINNKETMRIDRKGKGTISNGWLISAQLVHSLFEVVE